MAVLLFMEDGLGVLPIPIVVIHERGNGAQNYSPTLDTEFSVFHVSIG